MKKTKLLFALNLLFSIGVQAQSGSLDITFNNDGIFTYDFGNSDNMNDVKIQPDQKIVCTGIAFDANYNSTLTVMRLNQNGTLDNNFGVNGVFSFINGYDSYGYDSQILDGGKILVAGIAAVNFNPYKILLVRINSNGTLDTSFGNSGFTLTDFSPADNFAYGLAVQADGKIVIAGEMTDTVNYQSNPTMVRFDSNGFVDSTFGVNGQLLIPAISGDNAFRCITIQPDGKILAAGHYSLINTGLVEFDFCVARADVNGVLDPTFGTNGLVVTPVGNGLDQAFGMDLDTALNIVVAGIASGSNLNMALLKYDPTGTLDPNFGNNGVVIFDNASFEGANDVIVQPDNRIVVVGSSGSFPSPTAATVWKYLADGTLDSTFAGVGYVTTSIDIDKEDGNSVALQADGKIVIAGKYRNVNTANNDATVIRYNNTVVNTSVNEINVANSVSVFPNPASANQSIMITTEKSIANAPVKMIDLLGNLVFTTNGNFLNNRFEMQLPASISQGVYFIIVGDAQSKMVQKITIK